jgi:uncharacterized protein YbcV (DUF1398 family)
MFTLQQIKKAHLKVKTGADFPNYIKEIAALGVTNYETFVSDGHTDYFGADAYKITSASTYETLAVAQKSKIEQFQSDLKSHQQGETDYPTFCICAAMSGVEKWAVYMEKKTCTYYDKAGNELMVEQIPE